MGSLDEYLTAIDFRTAVLEHSSVAKLALVQTQDSADATTLWPMERGIQRRDGAMEAVLWIAPCNSSVQPFRVVLPKQDNGVFPSFAVDPAAQLLDSVVFSDLFGAAESHSPWRVADRESLRSIIRAHRSKKRSSWYGVDALMVNLDYASSFFASSGYGSLLGGLQNLFAMNMSLGHVDGIEATGVVNVPSNASAILVRSRSFGLCFHLPTSTPVVRDDCSVIQLAVAIKPLSPISISALDAA